MDRRDFIVLAATSTAATLALEGCGKPGDYGEPLYIANSKYVPGVDYWHATACHECSAGCGLIIRKRDGHANKVDGNPLHPISGGKSCARAQAALNGLYNPDRLKGPLKRKGSRGSGEFEPVSWDEAIATVAARLSDVISQGKGSNVLWLAADDRESTFHSLIGRLMKACGESTMGACTPFSREVERAAVLESSGKTALPLIDLTNADCVLSFGARFLETWDSPVFHARGFAGMRSRSAGRHKFIHAEPRMSMTAANADIWLPVRPGSEGLLALAIAAELQKLNGKESLIELSESNRASIGIPEDKIKRVAAALKQAQSAIVIGGESAAAHSNGRFNLEAINYLSSLVGSGASHSVPSAQSVLKPRVLDPNSLSAMLRKTELLLLHGANPVYSTPSAFKLREVITSIPYIVSFSCFDDETTALADMILPDHSPYEAWNDSQTQTSSNNRLVNISKPVIEPLYDTRHTGDVMLAVAKKVPQLASQATSDVFLDLVRAAHLEAADSEDADTKWEQIILRGGIWPDKALSPVAKASSTSTKAPPAVEAPSFSSDEKDYPFHFLPYEHLTLGFGAQANLPLAQELPDPMTSISWGSWLEMNPETASKLGLGDGDIVTVESSQGRIDVPIVVFPGIRPDTVAMPCGQGHDRLGRYATHRGANPLSILAPLSESKTGTLAWAATRVKVTPSGRKIRLAATGTNERLLEDRQFLR